MPTTDPRVTIRLLSTKQAADYLGLKSQTLRRWRMQGDGPAYVRLGNTPRARVAYRNADLDLWLDQRVFYSTSVEQ